MKIIAEIGINHNGSYETARQLISEAVTASVDAVKFQYRNLDNAYSDTVREIGDEILLREIRKNYLEPLALLELAAYARSLGIEAGTSFFDCKDMVDFGARLSEFSFFKLPSAELTNVELVDALINTGRHVYLSTGCHGEREVEAAFARLPPSGWTPMHCVSNYPTTLQNARLGYLTYLARRWDRQVGYSSHDDHWEACLFAMQLGAVVLERHITLDRRADGLDHSSSSTPDEFAKLRSFADNLDLLLSGDAPRTANQGELLNRQNLGRSFFAVRDFAPGELLAADSLVYRSPNIGLGRAEIAEFVGKPLRRPVSRGAALTRAAFVTPEPLSACLIEAAIRLQLSLPVRLHDLAFFQDQFPIGAYEFHLSFEEVLTNLGTRGMPADQRYSIHLPDYVASTLLMDPFSPDAGQREASLNILDRTVAFAERLQELTASEVPIVGSFSVVHGSLERFFSDHAELLKGYSRRGVTVMPQWLPPIAWYFGGSVRLHALNAEADANLLRQHALPVCMDVCHLLLGRNFFGFSAEEVMEGLTPNIRHVHLADAIGIDGEGIAIGEGEPRNRPVLRRALQFDCLKVVEVWQGHLDQGAGFRRALAAIAQLEHVDA